MRLKSLFLPRHVPFLLFSTSFYAGNNTSFIPLPRVHNSSKFRMFLKPPLPPAPHLTASPPRYDTVVPLPCPTLPGQNPKELPVPSVIWKPQTDKPYMCSRCGKGLSHIFTLKRHLKTVCGKVRNTSGQWKCDRCTRSYENQGNLVRHTRYECGVPRQFYCVICNRAFTQRHSLIRHLKKFHNDTMEFDRASVDSGVYCGSESVRSSI